MSTETKRGFGIRRWVITGLAALVTFLALSTYKFLELNAVIDATMAMPEFSETVETASPRAAEFAQTVRALGVAIAPKRVALRNELPGYITAVNYLSGARVAQGKVILQLDVSEQVAHLASANARAELAQVIYDRDLDLRASNAVSQESVDRARAELDVVRADIEAIQSVIDRKTIRAPFRGVIGIHQFEVGQYLDPNTEITTLVGDSNEMWVDFAIPQFYGELERGDTVRVRLVRGGGTGHGEFVDATVIAGDSTISTAARSRLYRAVVPSGSLELLHNASVEVEASVAESQLAFSVPPTSVLTDMMGQYVWVLMPEPGDERAYRARREAVTVSGRHAGRAIVTGAITEDDVIAGAGAFKLLPGLLVRPGTRPAAVAAGGGL